MSICSLKEATEQFIIELLAQKTILDTFLTLYHKSPERVELLNSCASAFFGRLQYILIELIILNMAKMVEGSHRRNTNNLSAIHLADIYTHYINKPNKVWGIARGMKALAQKTKRWRNKRIAHNDYNVSMGFENVKETFKAEVAIQFYELAENLVNHIRYSFGASQIMFETSCPGDAASLVDHLIRGQAFNEHFRDDPLAKWHAREKCSFNGV